MTDNSDNNQLVLISGQSGAGKSASLRNIRDQQRWGYMNCEAGKRLPFKNTFKSAVVTDPYQVWGTFDYAIAHPDEFDGLIIDTSTFLMDMFETQYIINSADTQKGWSNYAQFWKTLMQEKVAEWGKLKKATLILAHTRSELNEAAMQMEVSVPVKGALKNQGIEAYFSTVVSPKKIQVMELEKFKNSMLNIDDEDRELGFKHVFQTRITKGTTGERIRSPMGLFKKEETYIDSDAQVLLDHLKAYYA